MNMKSLVLLGSLLILLANCSSKTINSKPQPIVQTIKFDIPNSLLAVAQAPKIELLKGVVIVSNETNATLYLKALYSAWYINKSRLEAIGEVING